MNIRSVLLSSLDKVFLDEAPTAAPWESMSALKGEIVSFQWVLCPQEGNRLNTVIILDSPLSEFIRLYEVGHVPSTLPAYSNSDENFLRRKPGLFPDPLLPCHDGKITLFGGQWRGIWIEIKLPPDILAGRYTIRLAIAGANNPLEQLCSTEFTLTVIDAVLPQQTLIHTEWFHCDCLAVHYKVPVFSEEHWTLIERYMKNAVRYGINMILVPIFTPPLDTAIGGERPTVQLVDIEADGGHYRFGFTRLKRYLDMTRRAGIKYFEMAHLFTQWGAKHAPKIMAVKDGQETRIFGWDTDSVSPEYTNFLFQFLTQLKDFLAREDVLDGCWFHISDEPSIDNIEFYKAARDSISDVLKGCHVIDALSSIEFYRQGLVETPVPSNDHIHDFIEEGVPGLWTYYCCGQTVDVSNRMMAMPSQRNRIMGWQMFQFNIKGFLHWGYNFWFAALSKRPINPYAITDADLNFPSGDAFLVYPGEDGSPVPSIRQLVFMEGLQDMRALQLLESVLSHEDVKKLVESEFGADFSFRYYLKDKESLLKFREKINTLLSELLT